MAVIYDRSAIAERSLAVRTLAVARRNVGVVTFDSDPVLP
jgi:hypothetical protein